MDESTPASRWLKERGIPHRVFRHAAPVISLQQAAEERGQRPEQVVRSLVFRMGADDFLMVLAAGRSQVSWKRLRDYVGQNRLTMAASDEVLKSTGYRIGTVSPFGLASALRMLMDTSVLRQREVSLGSGETGVGIIMMVDDLLKALPGAERVDLIESA